MTLAAAGRSGESPLEEGAGERVADAISMSEPTPQMAKAIRNRGSRDGFGRFEAFGLEALGPGPHEAQLDSLSTGRPHLGHVCIGVSKRSHRAGGQQPCRAEYERNRRNRKGRVLAVDYVLAGRRTDL